MSVFHVHTWRDVLGLLDNGVLVYFLLLNSMYALLLMMSIPELWTHYHIAEDEAFRRLLGSDVLPPLSLLVPAYNEEITITSSVVSFLTLEYPRHEVILVNDGSTDNTMDVLISAFDLYEVPPTVAVTIKTKPVQAYYRSRRYSKLLVIDKENGGKADSLNAALNASRFPYVVAVDADTLIEHDALVRLARPFLLGKRVAAVGGTIRVVNGSAVENGRVVDVRVDHRLLPGVQTVEYLRAYLFGRLGWNRLGGNLVISGAFGLFRREYIVRLGGYLTDNITEDMDLVMRLHRFLHDNKIDAELPFIPDPVAWTEVPTSVRVLARQRERWHRGLITTLVAHRAMAFNPRYGTAGMLAVPFYFFGEMLAPLVELFGFVVFPISIWMGAVNWTYALTFMGVAMGYGFLLSVWGIILEATSFRRYRRRSDYVRLLAYALLENFGYRQMTVWFRLQSFWRFFRGVRTWGTMTREGFAAGKPATARQK